MSASRIPGLPGTLQCLGPAVATRVHNYELIYQLNAIEYLLCIFSSTCFGLTHPSSGAMDVKFLTYTAYGVLGVVRCRS